MRAKKIILPIIFCALAVIARADEIIPVLQVGSETYSNVTVTSVSKTDIFFTYADGMANVKIKNLSPELQEHFNFNPDLAQAIELKQAADKAKFHAQLLQQPDAHPPDMTRAPVARTTETAGLWGDDFPAVLKQAQAEKKLVLLNFTGSDWCPPCMMMRKEVFSKKEFVTAASKKFILVEIDFPNADKELKKQHEPLAEKYKIDGFPTVLLLTPEGKEFNRFYASQYPKSEDFLKHLTEALEKKDLD